MIRYLILFCLLWLNHSIAMSSPAPNKVLIVGDSISAAYGIDVEKGWVSLLASKITQENLPYQVINASISGDMTSNGLIRLPKLLKTHKPDVVVIELGGNDGLRGLPIRVIRTNLQRLIQLSKDSQARVLLAGMRIPPNYGSRYTRAFHQVYQDLAEQYEIELIPFLLEGIGDNSQLMQSDGIHPTADAQPLIVQLVWPRIKPLLM